MNNKSKSTASFSSSSIHSMVVDAVVLRKVLRLVHCLQKERGASCAYKASCRGPATNVDCGTAKNGRRQRRALCLAAAALKPARKDTDRAFEMILQDIRSEKSLKNFASMRVTLEKLRNMLIQTTTVTSAQGPERVVSMDTQQAPVPKNQTSSASGFHRILVCYNTLIQSIVHDYILKYTRQLPTLLRRSSSSSSTIACATAAAAAAVAANETQANSQVERGNKPPRSPKCPTNRKAADTDNGIPNNAMIIPRNFSLQMLSNHNLHGSPSPAIAQKHHRRIRTLSSGKASLLNCIHDYYLQQQHQPPPPPQPPLPSENHHMYHDNVGNSNHGNERPPKVDPTAYSTISVAHSDPEMISNASKFGSPATGYKIPSPPTNLLPPANHHVAAQAFLSHRMSTVSDTDGADDYDYYEHHHDDEINNQKSSNNNYNNASRDDGICTNNKNLLISSSDGKYLYSDDNEEASSPSSSSSSIFDDVYIDCISDDNDTGNDDDDQARNLDNLMRLLKLLDSFVRLKEATGVQRATLSSVLAAGQIESRMLVTDLVLEVENHRQLLEQLKQQKYDVPTDKTSVLDNVLYSLIQELITMSPAMQQLQNAILQGFDLNSLKQEFQNSPSQLWNVLTLYMAKLHSLELLLVEEIECCCELFTNHHSRRGIIIGDTKSTTVMTASAEKGEKSNNEKMYGSLSITIRQEVDEQNRVKMKQQQHNIPEKPTHEQQFYHGTSRADERSDHLIRLVFGINGSDPKLLQQIIERMSPEELRQRFIDATRNQSSILLEHQQKLSTLPDEHKKTQDSQLQVESISLQKQQPLQKQVPKVEIQPSSARFPPEVSFEPHNKGEDVINQAEENKNVPPGIKAVEDLLREISKAPASKEWEIDLYEIQFRKRIGQGAAGTTYLADWCDLQVAVKVASINEMGLDGWRTEVQALQKLHHPNIIRLLGSVYHPNPLTFCLVLEYCDAGDLSNALLKATPRNFFFLVASGASRGMSYLHSRGIIHRDIKPGNILLHGNVASGQFQVKVTDFGVATDSSSRANRTAETGTYRWMAPEVIRHENYSQTADVYSFAVVMWQLLTREEPFHDRGQIAAAAAVAIENVRPPFPDQTPSNIKELIVTCWSSEPPQRLPFDKIIAELNRIERALTVDEQMWLQSPLGHWVYKKNKNDTASSNQKNGGEMPDHDHKKHNIRKPSWQSAGQSTPSGNPAPSLLLPSAQENNKKKGLKSLFSRKVRYY